MNDFLPACFESKHMANEVHARFWFLIIACLVPAASCSSESEVSSQDDRATPPVIITTDLHHPEGDPDDHIDMAVAHGANMDVRALVLENTDGAGLVPFDQLTSITGLRWPVAIGRDGSELILKTLSSIDQPATIVTLGSLHEVSQAWKLNPKLMTAKVARLVVFAGDAADLAPPEHNVSLDPSAFLEVMASNLPVFWVPCFDGGLWESGSRSSFVQTDQAELFPALLPDPLEKFFSYRLSKSEEDPIAWLNQRVTSRDRALLEEGSRNIWAAGLMVAATTGDGSMQYRGFTVGHFVPTVVRFNSAGQVDPRGDVISTIHRWELLDKENWEKAMIESTLQHLKLVGP